MTKTYSQLAPAAMEHPNLLVGLFFGLLYAICCSKLPEAYLFGCFWRAQCRQKLVYAAMRPDKFFQFDIAGAERAVCEIECFKKAVPRLNTTIDPAEAKRVVGTLELRYALDLGMMTTGSGDNETAVDLEHWFVEMGSCYVACGTTYYANVTGLLLNDLHKEKSDKGNILSKDFSIDRNSTDGNGTCDAGMINRGEIRVVV
jgi:hypothetical protein